MPSIPISKPFFSELKSTLRDLLPQLRSSHAGESLAYSLGYRTYLAYCAAMSQLQDSAKVGEIDLERLTDRLRALGYELPADPITHFGRLLGRESQDDSKQEMHSSAKPSRRYKSAVIYGIVIRPTTSLSRLRAVMRNVARMDPDECWFMPLVPHQLAERDDWQHLQQLLESVKDSGRGAFVRPVKQSELSRWSSKISIIDTRQ